MKKERRSAQVMVDL